MNPSQTFLRSALFVLAALLLAACSSEPDVSPEQQVRDTLEAIEIAVEARSLSGIMEHVSDDYQDHRGQTKKDVARLMQLQIIRNQNITIFTRIKSIDIHDGIAGVELSSAMASRAIDLSIESNRLKADTAKFSLVLTKEGNQWQVQSGSWQRGW